MIGERRLVLSAKGSNEAISVRVSVDAPRDLAIDQIVIPDMPCACRVYTGVAEGGERDVYGCDKLQALSNALTDVDLFLKGLRAGGVLKWEDGREYDSELHSLFTGVVHDTLRAMIDE